MKNTAFLYMRSIVLLIINLYTSRAILQALGVSDYGIYQVVGGMVGMFSMLSSTMTAASQRFITYALGEKDDEKLRKVFSTSITLHLCLAAITVVILEVFGVWFFYNKLNIPTERIDVAFWVLQFSIASFFVNVISVPFNSLIVAHERMNAFAYISILDGVLKLCIVIALSFQPWDRLLVYAILYFLTALFIRIVYSTYSNRAFEEARHVKIHIESDLFKQMFAFAGWNLFGTGSMVLRNQGIDILLNIFFGVVVNAAKGISGQVQAAVHMLVGNFTMSINPQLTKSIAQNDLQRAHSLMFHGGKLAFFLVSLFAIPMIVSVKEVLSIWLGIVPDYAAAMVQLSMIYLLSDSLSRFLINSILAQGDIKIFQLISGGIKLLALPITYICLLLGTNPLTGLVVNVVLDVVCLFWRLYFCQRLLSFSGRDYLHKVVLRCWLCFSLAIIGAMLSYHYLSTNIIISVFVSLASTVLAIQLFGLNTTERKMVMEYARKFINKKNRL